MKNVMNSLLIVCLTSSFVYGNKYESAMFAAIQKLYGSNDIQGYLDAVSTFERIGEAEKDKWLPFYYAGLGYIWASHTTQEGPTVDEYLGKAQEFIDRASKLSPNNDELITLQGYIYMMKVVVDPPNRGPQFSGRAMQEFGKAVGMNENNPRALLLLGRMQMGTDQFFGIIDLSGRRSVRLRLVSFQQLGAKPPVRLHQQRLSHRGTAQHGGHQ